MYEEDFVDEKPREFKVGNKKFVYKPVTAAEELEWADEYIEIVDGKPKQNLKKLTQCKLRNLIGVPYDLEIINKILNVEKEWAQLSNKQRMDFLGKLKPSLFTKIINEINAIDSGGENDPLLKG